MFDSVHQIDWADLSHSHGSAIDVPEKLRALAGPSDPERQAALTYFWEYMLHQGSRYEASPYVVPFLFEVLESPNCRSVSRELIDLLRSLAVGYGESFLPFGYDIAREEIRYQESGGHGLFNYQDARAAYYQVQKRADIFPMFLCPGVDPDTRLSAAFAVANFAQPLSTHHTTVAAYISEERDEKQLQSLILCFGMLARFAHQPTAVDFLTPFLEYTRSPAVILSAAIAMTTISGSKTPECAVETIFEALNQAWRPEPVRTDWQWWNEGDLMGHAAQALRLLGPERRDDVAGAICGALSTTPTATFALPEALLETLFPEPQPQGGWNPSKFDETQRRSLRILLHSRHWTTWMISSKFLPRGLEGDAYQSTMTRFIDEVTGDTDSDFHPLSRSGNVSTWDRKFHWP